MCPSALSEVADSGMMKRPGSGDYVAWRMSLGIASRRSFYWTEGADALR